VIATLAATELSKNIHRLQPGSGQESAHVQDMRRFAASFYLIDYRRLRFEKLNDGIEII
jgi:hypothetical protein